MKDCEKLSVIIPCYNESKTIEELIGKVLTADSCGLMKEIIIVDDGSKDGTRDILEKYKKNKDFKYFFIKRIAVKVEL